MVACLWQANPSACGLDIIDALQKAGHQYFDPDSLYGFGIPDMIKADHILGSGNTDSIAFTTFLLFPNPAHDYTYLVIGRPSETNDELITVTMFDLLGSMKKQQTRIITGNRFVLDFQSLNTLATGLYVVQVVIAERTYSIPLMKI
jgi:serine protease AprX